jgi:NADH:ubiquinone oxidoreductase subunit 6 (subunit J)
MGAFQFLILDYYFLGLTYIIVYVGAIAILFLFVIMLIQTDKFEKKKIHVDGGKGGNQTGEILEEKENIMEFVD